MRAIGKTAIVRLAIWGIILAGGALWLFKREGFAVREHFQRERLPDPLTYFDGEGLRLLGRGIWRTALCPFHDDSRPSLSVNVQSGGYRCHACGAHGSDVLAFHRARYGLGFREAAQAFGAWRAA